jgi:diguanylate cyclase (GGDEF)-like protein
MDSTHPPVENKATPEDRLTIDPVTGLRNEHLFRLRLPEEFYRARDKETNAALLAVKLDRIIEINARHGRTGGDEALRALGNLLKQIQTSPGNDTHLLFKLSGPVFGYFIPDCGADQARHTAQDIIKEAFLSELFIDRITVSVGVVNLYEFFLREEDLGEIARLIEQTALFRIGIAEKNGGNTVCHTSEIADPRTMSRPTVLLVDPDQSSIEPLRRSLEAADFTVDTCRDGEEAFALVQAKPPGLIICEAMTPRLNGFMLKDRLQANVLLSGIPFILISHKKTEDFVRKAVDLDIRFYFQKPVSVIELTGLVSNLLRSNAV